MLFDILPVIVIDEIVGYLTNDELYSLRLVCKYAKEIARQELRRRSKHYPTHLRCCTSSDEINALISVYGDSSCFRHIEYSQVYHENRSYYRSPLFPCKDVEKNFIETKTLALMLQEYNFMHSPPPNFIIFETLREKWNSLNAITIKSCDGYSTHYLIALSERLKSVDICKNYPSRSSDLPIVSRTMSVSAETVNLKSPQIKYIAMNTPYDDFNMFQLLSTAKELREACIKITRESSIKPYLIAPLLKKLRLHLQNYATDFYFYKFKCETLKVFELKYCDTPSFNVLNKLMEQLAANVENFTLSIGQHLPDSFIYNAFARLRLLKIFHLRKEICFADKDDWSERYLIHLLSYLRCKCKANKVQIFLSSRSVQSDTSRILTFVYQIIRLATTTHYKVKYTVSYTQQIGYLVLPSNVNVYVVGKKISVQDIWKNY